MALDVDSFFPERPKIEPKIYAFRSHDPQFAGQLKVGYTVRTVYERGDEEFNDINMPDGKRTYDVAFNMSAMRDDGSVFSDKDVHKQLKRRGKINTGGEWFYCNETDVMAAYWAVMDRTDNSENRTANFKMRPEQSAAVYKTQKYYENFDYTREIGDSGERQRAKFLWNCKMRFGKTFAAYELAKAMNMKRVLILTFKPAVESAWCDDLTTHLDFEGWQFISRDSTLTYESADKERPIVCFGSFQDYMGTDKDGNIKAKNQWVHEIDWDLIIFDEYHFGAWRRGAKSLFSENRNIDREEQEYAEDPDKLAKNGDDFNETWLPITSQRYLYLSGTPFRALDNGEFIEDQIYSWTYSDEQREKENWNAIRGDNPYADLPRMVMMTYKMPSDITDVAEAGEYNEFTLNEFFKAEGSGKEAHFIHEDDVQKWLDLIRGQHMPTETDKLKLVGNQAPVMPFADVRLLGVLQHTVWLLPNVAACYAMANLLRAPQNTYYHDYTPIVCAGPEAGMGVKALEPVLKAMVPNPLETKTITLSCGKLMTGVTVKPWTGIFMLSDVKTPETYFQSAFRVQSPWTVRTDDGGREIVKRECYVFDFALNRALRQISDYSRGLDIKESNPEKKVRDFIGYLPVLAYDGAIMKQIDAGEVLDMAASGTTATLLAKKWKSAILVNVTNDVLNRLMNNEAAMKALSNIEGFRTIRDDIKTIINKSEHVKEAKKSVAEKTEQEKKELTQEEKEYKSKRREIQDKLLQFATRIPVFMYLTDYRENSVKDVIQKLEPKLFRKVTGLTVDDFNVLLGVGVFNETLMNDSVYSFRRYEESSLSYSGINKHAGEDIGGFSGSLTYDEYSHLYADQQNSII